MCRVDFIVELENLIPLILAEEMCFIRFNLLEERGHYHKNFGRVLFHLSYE